MHFLIGAGARFRPTIFAVVIGLLFVTVVGCSSAATLTAENQVIPTAIPTGTPFPQPTEALTPKPIPTSTIVPIPEPTSSRLPTPTVEFLGGYLIGDGRLSSEPVVGHVFSCATQFRDGLDHAGDWVDGEYWYPSKKPAVFGEVDWPDAWFATEVEGNRRLVTGNGLPLGHPTGNFPIGRNDPAYQFDPNPNSIREQVLDYSLTYYPYKADEPSCVPMGLIGIATNGVAFYNALDAAGQDAVAHEVQDECSGHPERDGQYHYHGPGRCHKGAQFRAHSLAGYALDGFPIFGIYNENGKEITNADLNECHGHTHGVMMDGGLKATFHYHLTNEYPYTIGCFMGDDIVRAQLAPPGQQGQALEPPPRR